MSSVKKPDWLKVSYRTETVDGMAHLLKDMKLNTVCKEANCPNLGECYARHTATFMIMGSECTRNCRFCNVITGRPGPLDPDEPRHVAEVVRELDLTHAVITQVTRDDLPDGGAAHMAQTIRAIKAACPDVTVEVLISDLKGDRDALETVLEARPDVLNHNVEMVPRLYQHVRPQAAYDRSLNVLSDARAMAPGILTKTGFMVGLGETDEEIAQLMDDIILTGCDILTISQYLQPTDHHWPLDRYVTPRQFDQYRDIALEKGFKFVASSPLVRSSYRAQEGLTAARKAMKSGR